MGQILDRFIHRHSFKHGFLVIDCLVCGQMKTINMIIFYSAILLFMGSMTLVICQVMILEKISNGSIGILIISFILLCTEFTTDINRVESNDS